MADNGVTKTYTLQLTLKGPCFAGSGRSVSKKEYSYDQKRSVVTFYDSNKLMECIVQNGLVDAFEDYMLGSQRTLFEFFQDNGGPEQFAPALQYEIRCGDAILGEGRQPANILLHSRNANGDVYIPGSSIKGMLRTAITAACVLKKTPNAQQPSIHDMPFLKNAKNCMQQLDEELFHALDAEPQKRNNAVNSIFRGISVADSAPIANENMVLCRKMDRFPQGGVKELNQVRECLRPGLTVKVPVTIDHSLAGFITPDFIKNAITEFDVWYMENVYSKYPGITLPTLSQHLFLGGGSGYFSKTVTGPWLQEKALPYITALLTLSFREKNARDESYYGISPHMLKCTAVNAAPMLYGLCEVDIS